MSLIEILTVIGVIAVLIAILLPGLNMVRKNAQMAKSQSNLRQIATFMTSYAQANRETIVPAAFDYSAQANDPRVKVRRESPPGIAPPLGDELVGTWSDILWTENKLGPILVNTGPVAGYDYAFDSPDRAFYDNEPDYDDNVMRSAVRMKRSAEGTAALPFGTGTEINEIGHPGYFACNEFFDIRAPGSKWWVTGEIKRPSLSVYLVDSYAGEITETVGLSDATLQLEHVDYRYPGDMTLMLFLDGHVGLESEWKTLRDLEASRQIRFRDLHLQNPF
ncbi:MAG: hypothetical protein SGJ11_11800 [Phycisphaerae bacterium]|nr:hypothetical protein [Phycisphaerae bacterium]